MRDTDKKLYLARAADAYARGQIDRRKFLRAAGKLGLGASAFALGSSIGRPWNGSLFNQARAQIGPSQAVTDWITEVGKPFAGQTVRMATESTPPSKGIAELVQSEFGPATGINVEIEVLPLEQVLQKLTLDVASGLGTYDCYYLDQSWMASFSQDVIDPREKFESQPDLAFPGYDFDDFLQPLVDGISMYNDVMVGVPYDIPIFITMYRTDIYEQLGLSVPETMDAFLENARAIQAAGIDAPGGNGKVFGTTGQKKSGHYSLECDWTAWLWGHGGSIFRTDGTFSGNDEQGIEAMEYWLKLRENMPPGVDTWTWDGQFQSVSQGIAGQVLSWGEFLPSCDDPQSSQVAGLLGVAPPPRANALRTVEETGYNEIPNTGHQGGSALALSKYSKVADAAWVFMQWATSPDTQARISVLGGGSSPMRETTFAHPAVKEAAVPGPGTTRHFDVMRYTIENQMGSEPDLPEWAELANNVIPVELGRFFAGEYDNPQSVMDEIAAQTNAITGKG
ncbi:MAG: ABC transporter substrate-binding protein [Geminicoccaceae bacterium]